MQAAAQSVKCPMGRVVARSLMMAKLFQLKAPNKLFTTYGGKEWEGEREKARMLLVQHLLSPTPPLLPGDFIRNSAGCWGNALIGHYIANHAISTHKSGHTNVHLRLKFPILTGLVHVRMLVCESESKRMD